MEKEGGMKWWGLFSCMLIRYMCLAQDPELVRQLEDVSAREVQVESEEDLQQLQQFRKHPLRINEAEAADLGVFPFLSAVQIQQFLLYRSLLGPLTEVYELQAVPGWDAQVIRRLMPFITVLPPGSLGSLWVRDWAAANEQVLLRVSSAGSTLLRYQRWSPTVGVNLVIEKDAGERWWQGRKGLPFVSGHIRLQGRGWMKQLLIGDYLVNLGQGLVLWQGRGLYKNSFTVMVKKQRAMLQPYRSTDENRFMRGVALLAGKGSWQALVFASHHRVDANLLRDNITGGTVVSSLLYSGLHRTDGELQDKDALAVVAGGLAVQFTRGRLATGVQFAGHTLDFPVQKRDEPYNLFAIQGRHFFAGSMNASYGWSGVHLFGELAWSRGRGAGLAGAMMALARNMDLALLYRQAGRDYHAWGASAFTEGAEVNNEQGIYLGMSWRLPGGITVDAYADRFRFPWLKYRVNGPSEGFDHLLQFTWKPDKQTRLFIRFSQLEKAENAPAPAILPYNLTTGRSAIRFHLEKLLANGWEWRGRVERTMIKREDGFRARGFMGYLECHGLWRKASLAGNLRWAFFDVSDYEARIYAYEPDVMYYSTIPASFGRGMLVFLNLRYPVNDKLNLYLKCFNAWKEGIATSYIRGQLIFSW